MNNNEYMCEVCGKFITEEQGVTTLSGLFVCDCDTCRTLDEDNQATEIFNEIEDTGKKLEKFEVKCRKCGSGNVKLTVDDISEFNGDYFEFFYTDIIIAKCLKCGSAEHLSTNH